MQKGEGVIVLTSLYHFYGVVEEYVPGVCVLLSSAHIIYETGPWATVAKGSLKKTEKLPADVTVSLVGGAWMSWTPK